LTPGATVLITGARAPAALDLARAFRAAGHPAHMADCSPCWTARLSTAPSSVQAYASPVHRPEAFAADIDRLLDTVRPVLVIPACEEVFHLAALARRRPALAGSLFAPPFETLRTLHSKRLFAQACVDQGLPVPETWTLTDPGDLAGLPPTQSLVLKPEYSRFGVNALIRPEPEALATLPISSERPWVAQRHVAGTEMSFYAVARADRLTAFCAYGSTWRERGGASYAFAPPEARATAILRDLAVTLAARIVHDGQFACDVILDAQGQPWLLECNPRATSGVHLFMRDAALARAFHDDAPRVEPRDPPFLYLGPAFALFGLPAAIRSRGLAEWRTLRREGRDVIGASGDRLPLAGALVDSAAFAARALVSGRSLAAAMTADIEWNGAAA
jgi:glutathione synthase/RimK-type ligase-like ATP-grasp enzyme